MGHKKKLVGQAVSPAHRVGGRHRLPHLLLLAGLIGIIFIAYSNSLYAPFLLDNGEVILNDTRIRAATSDNLHRIFTGDYWPETASRLYRPLTTLSYLFNYTVLGDGTRPAGYHWVNLLLHAVNVMLVYALGWAIFEGMAPAFLLAALWGVHPVLTESVTNTVGRADLLAAFAVLAALLAHIQAMRTVGGRKGLWLAAMALAVTAGMFSKESAIVVVAAMALYDLAFAREVSWRARVPGYAAVAVPCLVYLFVRARVIAHLTIEPFQFLQNPLTGADFWTARLTAVKVMGRYFQLLVWPARQSCDYSYNEIPVSGLGDWKVAVSLLVCLAAAVLAFRAYRLHRPVFFFIGFFFAAILPVSNLVILIGTIMGERFLYLPSIGFAGCVVYALLLWRKRLPENAVRIAVGVILLALAARTYARNSDWLDQQRLWRSAMEAAPGGYMTHMGAAVSASYLTPADWDRNLGELDRALAIIDPLPELQSSSFTYMGAGILYRTKGDNVASTGGNATPWYRKSLEVLLRGERIGRARTERSRLENEPRGTRPLQFVSASLYMQIGRAYLRLGDPHSAAAAYELGRKLLPDPDILQEAAEAYRQAGDKRRATLAMVEALAVDSSRAELKPKLVDLYREIDPQGCAVNADGLDVNCPLVHGDICTASGNVARTYRQTDHPSEAAVVERIAVQELGCRAEDMK